MKDGTRIGNAVYRQATTSEGKDMENTTFSQEELQLMQILVNRAHSNNASNGMGNNADMNSLLRKLNTLTDNEAANNE